MGSAGVCGREASEASQIASQAKKVVYLKLGNTQTKEPHTPQFHNCTEHIQNEHNTNKANCYGNSDHVLGVGVHELQRNCS